MFISKKDYKKLCDRVSALEEAVGKLAASILSFKREDAKMHTEITTAFNEKAARLTNAISACADGNDITDVLFGFAQDIDELRGKVSDLKDAIEDENGSYQQERSFLQGLHSINTFTGVMKNGE